MTEIQKKTSPGQRARYERRQEKKKAIAAGGGVVLETEPAAPETAPPEALLHPSEPFANATSGENPKNFSYRDKFRKEEWQKSIIKEIAQDIHDRRWDANKARWLREYNLPLDPDQVHQLLIDNHIDPENIDKGRTFMEKWDWDQAVQIYEKIYGEEVPPARAEPATPAAPPLVGPKVAERPASRQPDAPAKHEPILAKNGAAEVPKVNRFSLDSLESFETFAEKKELELKESYEESLDRAIEALKNIEGIVELKNQDVPTIVISDLHTRRDFLANVLSQKDRDGKTVLELLEAGKINVVCLGDGMHSEIGKNWHMGINQEFIEKDGVKYPKNTIADMNEYEKVMKEEMVRSLGMMKMVMELKSAFPDSFHYLRGNHDDIDETIRNFSKFFAESEIEGIGGESGLVKKWVAENFGQEFLEKWAKFEGMLPLVVQGKGFVASHTVPGKQLTRQQINDREKGAAEQLLWTDNRKIGDKDPARQHVFRENLKVLGAPDSKWIIGHRSVSGKSRQQFGGQLVQINSPSRQLVALFSPWESFDPEKNIFDLKVDKIDGLDTPRSGNEERDGALEKESHEVQIAGSKENVYSPEQEEWINGLGEEAQTAYDFVVEELIKKDEIEDITDQEIISGRIKPYLKKIFRLKIIGERGFTKKDQEYAVQAAVSKVKFNRHKAS